MKDSITIGNHITFLRKQKKLTQEELAQKLNISVQTISKWENGHTLPESAILPMLSELLNSSIDSILIPVATRDKLFQTFVSSLNQEQKMLAQLLYNKIKEKFEFFVSYNNEYYVFEHLSKGASAVFNIPTKDDFIIRMDVEDSSIVLRLTLPNCSKYMNLIENMPENIKNSFRCNDCRGCQGVNCSYCMVYTFENISYRQCHFIGNAFNSVEDIHNLFALICAEHGVK